MRKRYFFFSFLAALCFSCNFFAKEKKKNNGLKSLLPSFVRDSIYSDPENSFSQAKAELGRYLFYDRRLSVNNTKACASCHAQEFSFTDNYTRSIGALGDLHQRNSRPLINIIFSKYLTAADSTLHFPEQQINNPMMNEHSVEMGIKGNEEMILRRLKADDIYTEKFGECFPGEKNPYTIKNVQWAITSFVKKIFSFNSPYDDYAFRKNETALNEQQKKGMQLFFSDSLHCKNCHGGINFSTPLLKDENGSTAFYFNTGLYNIDGRGSYPEYDQGLIELTKNPADMGKYKVPTLRNLAFTAPYFHDGSATTLEDVIMLYENGGRNISTGAFAGDGRRNPYKHPLVSGFHLNSQQRNELISFLLSLTDSSIYKNPDYANPFKEDETKK
jgi:cytochrome c peroxidase